MIETFHAPSLLIPDLSNTNTTLNRAKGPLEYSYGMLFSSGKKFAVILVISGLVNHIRSMYFDSDHIKSSFIEHCKS